MISMELPENLVIQKLFRTLISDSLDDLYFANSGSIIPGAWRPTRSQLRDIPGELVTGQKLILNCPAYRMTLEANFPGRTSCGPCTIYRVNKISNSPHSSPLASGINYFRRSLCSQIDRYLSPRAGCIFSIVYLRLVVAKLSFSGHDWK